MAVCDFDMCFTFVWPGWEGSAHDTRIFLEATRDPSLHFPHPLDDIFLIFTFIKLILKYQIIFF
jgi:hypothetical protein